MGIGILQGKRNHNIKARMNWNISKASRDITGDHMWKAQALKFDLLVTGEHIRAFSKGERMGFGCPCLRCVTEAEAERSEGSSGRGLAQPVTPTGGWAHAYIKDQAWPFLSCFFSLGMFLKSLFLS